MFRKKCILLKSQDLFKVFYPALLSEGRSLFRFSSGDGTECVSLAFIWCLIIIFAAFAVGLVRAATSDPSVPAAHVEEASPPSENTLRRQGSPLLLPPIHTSAAQIAWTVQLHHSYRSLCLTKNIASPSARRPPATLLRRVPMICYYLFLSLCSPKRKGKKRSPGT